MKVQTILALVILAMIPSCGFLESVSITPAGAAAPIHLRADSDGRLRIDYSSAK